MVVVAEEELQRMLSWRQRNFRLGLSAAEVEMIQIARDLAIERWERCIDQQVMMAGVGSGRARRDQFHSGNAESYDRFCADRRAVGRFRNENAGAGTRGRPYLFDCRRI